MKKNANAIAQSTIIALIFVWVMLLLNSCSTSRHTPYRDPVKSPDTYVRGGSRECGWAY